MIADAAPPHLRATSFGAFLFASGIGAVLASLGAGWLWDRHGSGETFIARAPSPRVALAMLSLLPAADSRSVAEGPHPVGTLDPAVN